MTTKRCDQGMLQLIRDGDARASASARELVIENDNPVWTTLLRYGPSITVRDAGPQYQTVHRVHSISKSDERLEVSLAAGRHRLRWKDSTFEVEISSPDDGGRAEARVHLASDEACQSFGDFISHARECSRQKCGADADKLVVKVMRGMAWKTVSSYPKRPVDSLITGDTTVQDLLSDMREFVASEDDYVRFGRPFKRNYLVIGPPGSGKSSLVSVAAATLDMDLCFISVVPGMTERELCTSVSALNDNSMLVLEDVDVLCSVAASGNSGGQSALAILTNVLDGALHRHKLITVLTSSNPSALESVLTRHGRIDFTSRLGALNEKQVHAMVAYAFSCPPRQEDDAAVGALAGRLWSHIQRLESVTSTVLAQFLFKHRNERLEQIDEAMCAELSQGTHTAHIDDARQIPRTAFYM